MEEYEKKFEEALENIEDNSLKYRLVSIKNLILMKIQLHNEFKTQRNKLQAKYENIYKPIYEKRAKIIKGTDQTILDKSEFENNPGIPDFWLKCIENTRFGYKINVKDTEILKYLINIKCKSNEDGSFTFGFQFNKNQYFDEKFFTKQYKLENNIIKTIISSEINWKSEDINPTLKKKTNNRKKKIEKHSDSPYESVDSFFDIFKSYDEDNSDEELMTEQYEEGLFIKDQLIGHAIEYYLGVAVDEYEIGEDSIES
jgi:nucleosome assembly protein 1-like 1